MKKELKSKKGMTLVEIITVIAIIVILASAAFFGYMEVWNKLGLKEAFAEQTEAA